MSEIEKELAEACDHILLEEVVDLLEHNPGEHWVSSGGHAYYMTPAGNTEADKGKGEGGDSKKVYVDLKKAGRDPAYALTVGLAKRNEKGSVVMLGNLIDKLLKDQANPPEEPRW